MYYSTKSFNVEYINKIGHCFIDSWAVVYKRFENIYFITRDEKEANKIANMLNKYDTPCVTQKELDEMNNEINKKV